MAKAILGTTFVALVLVARPAFAIPVLDFNETGGGTVSYAGGSAVLTGTITENSVKGLSTPLQSGTSLTINTGVLTFTTGAETGTWTWGANLTACTSLADGGCSIVITGSIPAQGTFGGTTGTLLAGRVTGATVDAGGNGLLLATFVNFVDPTLAAFFGLSGGTTPWQSANNINIGLPGIDLLTAGSRFTCSATSADCAVGSSDLFTTPSPAPEPASLVLLGSGLLGLTAGLRRRRKALKS